MRYTEWIRVNIVRTGLYIRGPGRRGFPVNPDESQSQSQVDRPFVPIHRDYELCLWTMLITSLREVSITIYYFRTKDPR